MDLLDLLVFVGHPSDGEGGSWGTKNGARVLHIPSHANPLFRNGRFPGEGTPRITPTPPTSR